MTSFGQTGLHPEVAAVTDRVIERSRAGRAAYLDLIAAERDGISWHE